MYKITVYDANNNPICDGVTYWFVEDLDQFETKWLPLQVKQGVHTVDRYYRSKHGEIVTDWYSESPELNIVQEDESSVITDNKHFSYSDIEIVLHNAYNWETTVGFKTLDVDLVVIKYDNEYYLCGQYKGIGCYCVNECWNRWYEKETKYSQMHFYGNPIAEYKERMPDWDKQHDSDAYKDFYTNDKDFYKDESIETFVWLPIKKVDENYKIEDISKEDLSFLLQDIVGEAG